MRKIFITGCAKSGTTMVLGLFHAFQYPCIPLEITLAQFEWWFSLPFRGYGGIVGKRAMGDIFASDIPMMEQQRAVNFITSNNIEVVHVVRNKEDVLKSTDGYISEERYDAVEAQTRAWPEAIRYTISYDEILLDPLGMQYTLMMELGLEMLHQWEDYPDFVPLLVHASADWNPRRIGEPRGK